MEAPIARKAKNHPRDFIMSKSRNNKPTKQYTFNHEASISSSKINADEMNLEMNPEEVHQEEGLQYKSKKKINRSDIQFSIKQYKKEKDLEDLMNQKQTISEELDKNERKCMFEDIQIEISPTVNMKNRGSEYRKSVLPELPTRRDTSEAKLAKTGRIIRQNGDQMRYIQLPESQTEVIDILANKTSQKPFNQLALSLIGVKRSRSRNNKSCIDKRSYCDLKKDYEGRYKNKEHIEVYEHSVLPFRAEDIKEIKSEINSMIMVKQMEKSRYSPEKTAPQRNMTPKLERREIVSKSMIESDAGIHMNFSQIRLKGPERHIKVYHKTSLANLKSLLTSNLDVSRIIVEPPQFFTKPSSQFRKLPHFDSESMQTQAAYIFTSMSIPIENIHIRKYSNCIVIVNGNLCIVWHEGPEGKRYFGSWKNKYFDEGAKHGMGLEWAPGRYIYYGQFQQNKRHGFGVMRRNDQNVTLGFWKEGKHVEYGIEKNFAW